MKPTFASVNDAARAGLPALLEKWLPGGVWKGKEYTPLSPRRLDANAGGGFSINRETGAWFDSGGSSGGDPVSLYAYIYGLEQHDALIQLATELGLNGNGAGQRQAKSRKDDRGKQTDEFDYDKFFEVRRYEKFNADGERIKAFVQGHYSPDRKIFFEHMGGPGRGGKPRCACHPTEKIPPRLFRQNQIVESAENGDARGVAIVAGEKCVLAMESIGCQATTNSGGEGKWRPEFNPLFRGRKVMVLPDNDPVGAKHAATVCAGVAPYAGEVRRVELPGLPPKGDVADFIKARKKEGRSDEQISDEINALYKATPVFKVDPVTDADPTAASPGGYKISRIGATVRLTEEGDSKVVAYFNAKITEQITRDDGDQVTSTFKVEAQVDGRPRVALVPARDFAKSEWVLEQLGPGAIIPAPRSNFDRLREAILHFSRGQIRATHIHAHVGWKKSGDRNIYLQAGGGIGETGVIGDLSLELPPELRPFNLPPPFSAKELVAAVHAIRDLLKLAPGRIMAPLFGAIWRAVLGAADFSLHLFGDSGAFKTALTALFQQFFGAGFDADHLPGAWSGTANSLEVIAFLMKDAVFVIDDYKPVGTRIDRQRLEQQADRFLRAVGNSAGRSRLKRDSTLRPTRSPRCLPLSSGEELFPGTSLNARVLTIEVRNGVKGRAADVDLSRLTECQRAAAAGTYAGVMSAYLQWLAPRLDQVQAELKTRVAELRREEQAHGFAHPRTSGIFANLLLGCETFSRFAVETGALRDEEAAALTLVVRTGLLEAAHAQKGFHAGEQPAFRFIDLLRSAISSGGAHVVDAEGNLPPDAASWGWRKPELARPALALEGGGRAPLWQPLGAQIGWLQGDDLLLDPDAAYKSASVMIANGMSVSESALRRRLRDADLLVTTGADAGRESLTVRRTLQGKRREVLHLKAATLEAASDDPKEGDISTARTTNPEESS